jgi:hypothetical protein
VDSEGEEDSTDRSFTVLVRVKRRCLPAPPHRARWPVSLPSSARASPANIPDLHWIGGRPDRADPPPNGVWNAHRRRAGSGVASQPHTPIVHERPLVGGALGLALADLCGFCTHDRGRRHIVEALRQESIRGGWHHDGAAKGPKLIGFGNCWVVAGIVVQLSSLSNVPAGAGPARATPPHRKDRTRPSAGRADRRPIGPRECGDGFLECLSVVGFADEAGAVVSGVGLFGGSAGHGRVVGCG